MDFTNSNETQIPHYTSPQQMSVEQLQWLLKILSSDDREKLGAQMKQCTGEMTLTRGLPTAAVVCGSLYYARKRLPPKFHFGPKGWPIYLLAGFGSLTLANLLTMNTCGERVKPLLWELYKKYNVSADSRGKTYDNLREANRARFGHSELPKNDQHNYTSPTPSFESNSPPSSDSYSPYSRTSYGARQESSSFGERSRDLSKLLESDELPPLMPGTPYSSSPPHESYDQPQAQSAKTSKNQYGDVDFS